MPARELRSGPAHRIPGVRMVSRRRPPGQGALRRNNAQARGAPGLAWLESLPALIAALRREWDLTLGAPYPHLSYNYVLRATTAAGEPAALKLTFPGDPETGNEIAALRLYAGDGITRLLAADPARGALLIERLEPGVPLHTLRDEEEEVMIAARLMRRLWRPVAPDHHFPTVAGWGEAFARHRAQHAGSSGPLPPRIFEVGERLYHRLDASASGPVLLHGDLHHENILSATREPWLAIDPKGLAGDPGFEVGAYLHNLWADLYPERDPRHTVARRVALFAEALGMDRERVRAWGIAFAVLSAVWSAENGGTGWSEAIRVAEALAEP